MKRWFEQLLRKSGLADEDPRMLYIAGLSAAAILALAIAMVAPAHSFEPSVLSVPV